MTEYRAIELDKTHGALYAGQRKEFTCAPLFPGQPKEFWVWSSKFTPAYLLWLERLDDARKRPVTTHEAKYADGSHRAVWKDDGKEAVTFEWHFPPHTFDARMSALEIAGFILTQMVPIMGLLTHFKNPRIVQDWQVMYLRLALWPEQVLDEMLPWIRTERTETPTDDQLIVLDLGNRKIAVGPSHFVLGS